VTQLAGRSSPRGYQRRGAPARQHHKDHPKLEEGSNVEGQLTGDPWWCSDNGRRWSRGVLWWRPTGGEGEGVAPQLHIGVKIKLAKKLTERGKTGGGGAPVNEG
jgi:hypothetical protein